MLRYLKSFDTVLTSIPQPRAWFPVIVQRYEKPCAMDQTEFQSLGQHPAIQLISKITGANTEVSYSVSWHWKAVAAHLLFILSSNASVAVAETRPACGGIRIGGGGGRSCRRQKVQVAVPSFLLGGQAGPLGGMPPPNTGRSQGSQGRQGSRSQGLAGQQLLNVGNWSFPSARTCMI